MDSKGHQKLTRKKASGGQLLVGAFCRDATAPDNDKAIVQRSAVSPTDRADDSGISLYQPSPEPPEDAASCRSYQDSQSRTDAIGGSTSTSEDEEAETHLEAGAMGELSFSLPHKHRCEWQSSSAGEDVESHSSDHSQLSESNSHEAVNSDPDRKSSPSLRSSGSSSCGEDAFSPSSVVPNSSSSYSPSRGLVFAPAESFEGHGETDTVLDEICCKPKIAVRRLKSLPASAVRTARRLSLQPTYPGTSESEEDVATREDTIQKLYKEAEQLNAKINSAEQEKDTSISRSIQLKSDLDRSIREVHELEDRLRESEIKFQTEKRLLERDFRLKTARRERQLAQQMDVTRSLLTHAEETVVELRQSESSLRAQLRGDKEEREDLHEDIMNLKQKHDAANQELDNCRDQMRREAQSSQQVIETLREQLGQATRQVELLKVKCGDLQVEEVVAEHSTTNDEMQEKVSHLEKELVKAKRQSEELYSLLLLQGKAMMMDGEDSLATELEEQSKDELLSALQSERQYGQRLNQYIESLLGVIMEKCPNLLEAKAI